MAIEFNTGKVRFSYPHLDKPSAMAEGQTAKYGMVVLIPKTDKETYSKIMKACKQLFEENKNTTFKGFEFSEVALPIHDGDGRKPKGGAYGDECKGQWVLSTSSKNRPGVVDGTRNAVPVDEIPQKAYAGCYGRVRIALAAYNVSGGKGINCYLNGVQTYGYGEAFSGGHFEANDFDDGYTDDGDGDEDFGL